MKLTKSMFGYNCSPTEIYISNPGQLPIELKPAAAVCFANQPDALDSDRGKAHIKYIQANAAKLMKHAFDYIELLKLMCENKLLKPEVAEVYLAAAQEKQNAEAIAMLLDYQQNKLTSEDKQKSEDKKAQQEEEVIARAFSRVGQEGIEGLNIAVSGAIPSGILRNVIFRDRQDIKAFLETKKAKLAYSITAKVDLLVTDDPTAKTDKIDAAQKLGIEIIGWDEFNRRSGLVINGLWIQNNTVIGVENTSASSITIPESVTSIGDGAFAYCFGLTSITIPEGVMSIGAYAFAHRINLTSITIPESVTSIGDVVFEDCTSLKKIVIHTAMKLKKSMFGKECSPTEIYISNPGQLPNDLKPAAAVGFANQPDALDSERGKAHIKYIKANAAKLMEHASNHIELLKLMCENKLLKPEVAEEYLVAAQEKQNAEAIAMLLDYQQHS